VIVSFRFIKFLIFYFLFFTSIRDTVDHQDYQPNEFSMSQTLNNNGPYMPAGASMSTILPSAQHAEHVNVYKRPLTVNTNHASATSSPANSTPNTPTSEHPPNFNDDQRGGVGDDDKRRRNTAASARFRIKKKQREQALERTAKEMTEKSDRLESRVKELELEIKWLRSLLLEKDSRQPETTDSNAKKDH
jgi:Basic region leucine zipper